MELVSRYPDADPMPLVPWLMWLLRFKVIEIRVWVRYRLVNLAAAWDVFNVR